MKRRTKNISIIAGITAVTAGVTVFALNTSGSGIVTISSLPDDIISASIEYCDSDWNVNETEATVTINSNNTASIQNITEGGFYTVTFCTATAETGSTEFFYGEDSGDVYSYEYVQNSDTMEYSPEFNELSELEYTAYENRRLLDLGGDTKVTIKEVPAEVVNADIYVVQDNGDYGNMTADTAADANGSIAFSLGFSGEYSVSFFDAENAMLGGLSFYLDENGALYSYNSDNEKEAATYLNFDGTGVYTYTDEEKKSDITVSSVPDDIVKIEAQYFNEEYNPVECAIDYSVNGDGTATAFNLSGGYYTLDFYDEALNLTGIADFYIDSEGNIYSYTIDSATGTPVISELSAVVYEAISLDKSYSGGDIGIDVLDVPASVDSVDVSFLSGEENDETIVFEPEMTYDEGELIMTLSGLGAAGEYRVNFYTEDIVVGNAYFTIGTDGLVYDTEYVLNSDTGELEPVLVETDCVFYIENTDIRDSDNYSYGSLELTITNVPSNVKIANIYFYGDDDTYSDGNTIFPDVEISGSGTVTVEKLGQTGYHEAELVLADCVTKVGNVFFYIDSDLNINQIQYEINPDTFEIEKTMTKASAIALTEYDGGVLEYESGDYSVNIYDVPVEADNILFSCCTPEGEYALGEREITVASDGTFTFDGLGMEGNYTVSFMDGEEYLGTATFYMKADGTISTAEFVYEGSDVSTVYTELEKVVFSSMGAVFSYELGDIDFSGAVKVADLVALRKYMVRLTAFDSSQFSISDMNNDAVVDVFDFTMLKNKLVTMN